MHSEINELVRRCYCGDTSAWETLIRPLENRMQRFLYRSFRTVPKDLLNEFLAQYMTGLYCKLLDGLEEANSQIRQLPDTTPGDEIETLKIKCCTDRTKFDLSYGSSFEAWLKQCLRRHVIQKLKEAGRYVDIETVPDDSVHELPPNPQALFEIKEQLQTVMEGNELIYLKVLFACLTDPETDSPDRINSAEFTEMVRAAIAKKTGKTPSDPTLTALKQSVMIKFYLQLLKQDRAMHALATMFFLWLKKIKDIQQKMFEVMLEILWRALCDDQEAVRKSKTEISPASWKRWEGMTQTRGIQREILVEAYRHFCSLGERPQFCYLIELYSDNRFGGEIRKLFGEGGAE